MQHSGFRFAAWLAGSFLAATFVVAWIYDLPVRDPDSVAGPTYFRLPAILLAAFLLDVVPRSLWAAGRRPWRIGHEAVTVVRERWTGAHLRFAFLGLAAWYVTYASFRNLKSYVPFVNLHLWDGLLEDVDRALFLGNDPAVLMHQWLGTDLAAHFFSAVYILWIGLIPASLVIALVWSRDTAAGAWYVTAIAVDWVLGVLVYFALPTLGPVYARPEMFEDLARTDVTALQEMMMAERQEVLVNPFTTDAVQTIAAFASLHVGLCVTAVVVAELLRLHWGLRAFLWVFLALTVPSTVYLGWHYAVDAVGGALLGVAGAWIAAKGTGQEFRRRPRPSEATVAASHPARTLEA